jgi:hypothetical protein
MIETIEQKFLPSSEMPILSLLYWPAINTYAFYTEKSDRVTLCPDHCVAIFKIKLKKP